MKPLFSRSGYHHWSPVPGVTISSRFRWSFSSILIFVVVVMALLGLWFLWQTPTSTAQQLHEAPPPVVRPSRAPPHSSPHKFIPSKKRRRRLTPKQRQHVLAQYGHRCAWCRRALSGKPWLVHFDHIKPLSSDPSGRLTSILNSTMNYQPLCVEDHREKK